MELKNTVRTLTKHLKTDDELWRSYRDNIAICFIDTYYRYEKRYKNREDIHLIANNAAKNFLDKLCLS